jgi:hypothetical protein
MEAFTLKDRLDVSRGNVYKILGCSENTKVIVTIAIIDALN